MKNKKISILIITYHWITYCCCNSIPYVCCPTHTHIYIYIYIYLLIIYINQLFGYLWLVWIVVISGDFVQLSGCLYIHFIPRPSGSSKALVLWALKACGSGWGLTRLDSKHGDWVPGFLWYSIFGVEQSIANYFEVIFVYILYIHRYLHGHPNLYFLEWKHVCEALIHDQMKTTHEIFEGELYATCTYIYIINIIYYLFYIHYIIYILYYII